MVTWVQRICKEKFSTSNNHLQRRNSGVSEPRYNFSLTTLVFSVPPTWSVCYTICMQASDKVEYSKAASARDWPKALNPSDPNHKPNSDLLKLDIAA